MAIITRRINCFDPLKKSLNYLDPVDFRHTRPGDAKPKIRLMSPYKSFLSFNFASLQTAKDELFVHTITFLTKKEKIFYHFSLISFSHGAIQK